MLPTDTDAPQIKLELNGKQIVAPVAPPQFGNAQFEVPFLAGNLTAGCLSSTGAVLATDTKVTTGPAASIRLSLDAPSPLTGTGSFLVADGEDTAMVRAELLDSTGALADQADAEIVFAVKSGDGKIWATHNGDASSHEDPHGPRHQAYHGLARAFVRSTSDHATPLAHRRRLLEVDLEGGISTRVADGAAPGALPPIIVTATAAGLKPATLAIPLSADVAHLPLAVAARASANVMQ